jgi:hypothetical protein
MHESNARVIPMAFEQSNVVLTSFKQVAFAPGWHSSIRLQNASSKDSHPFFAGAGSAMSMMLQVVGGAAHDALASSPAQRLASASDLQVTPLTWSQTEAAPWHLAIKLQYAACHSLQAGVPRPGSLGPGSSEHAKASANEANARRLTAVILVVMRPTSHARGSLATRVNQHPHPNAVELHKSSADAVGSRWQIPDRPDPFYPARSTHIGTPLIAPTGAPHETYRRGAIGGALCMRTTSRRSRLGDGFVIWTAIDLDTLPAFGIPTDKSTLFA